MSTKTRKQPRFKVGESVQILSTITTRFDGMNGIVTNLEASQHAHTLDKYRIRFADKTEEVFWDIQLKTALTDRGTAFGTAPVDSMAIRR